MTGGHLGQFGAGILVVMVWETLGEQFGLCVGPALGWGHC